MYQNTNMNDLPPEILHQIISLLSFDQNVTNRAVSKYWYGICNDTISVRIPKFITKKLLSKMVHCDPELLVLIEDKLSSKQKNHLCACFAYLGDEIKIEYWIDQGAVWNCECTNYALYNEKYHLIRHFDPAINIRHIPYEVKLSARPFRKRIYKKFLKIISNQKYQTYVADWLKEHSDDFLKLEKLSLVAIKNSNCHVLEFLNSQPNRYVFGIDELKYVIQNNDLEMFQWIMENCLIKTGLLEDEYNQNLLFIEAAYHGKLDILKYIQSVSTYINHNYLHEGIRKVKSADYQYRDTKDFMVHTVCTAYIASIANNQNYVEQYLLLYWSDTLHDLYYDINQSIVTTFFKQIITSQNIIAIDKLLSFDTGHYLIEIAIKLGNLNICQHIHQRCPLILNHFDDLLYSVAIHGHADILQYLSDHMNNSKQKIIYYGRKLMLFAIQHDHLNVAKWLVNFWDREIIHSSIRIDYAPFWNQKIYGWLKGFQRVVFIRKRGKYEPVTVGSIYNLKRIFCVDKMCYMTGTMVRFVKTNQRTLDYVTNYIRSVGMI